MKIGILTLHHAINYGAFLQCYALQEVLKSLGHDVGVIDYSPRYFKKDYTVANFDGFKSLSLYRKFRRVLGIILLFIPRIIRRMVFLKSIKSYLRIYGNSFSDIEETDISFYDVIVFGSDQIWNPKITRGFDSVFWGDFNFQGKKIAYAASTGDDFSILENDIESFKNSLLNFSSISVRERRLEKFLIDKCNAPSETVLDPTLLLDDGKWSEFAGDGKKSEKYLLLYIVIPSLEAKKIARKIAKELHLKVKEIFPSASINPMSWANASCSPSDFVRLFRDSQFVVTTSFHGTSFAINFHKKFYAVNTGKPNERILSLLQLIGLEDRYVYSVDDVDDKYIDFLLVSEKLQNEKTKSFSFIVNSMSLSEV